MSDSLVNQMEKYKEDFYQTQGKNTFFKKSQKLDCAKQMSKVFDLSEMIQQTIYLIPGTNNIVFNYPIFKLYGNDDNYDIIIQYIIHLYDLILNQYPVFNIHVILDTFTITAAERYKGAIKKFTDRCMVTNTNYAERLSHMYTYNTPSMIESITNLLKPFLDPLVKEKVIFYGKAESEALLKTLYATAVIEPIAESVTKV